MRERSPIHTNGDQVLHLHNINGLHICSMDVMNNLNTLLITRDSRFLLTGGSYRTANDNALVVRTMHDLAELRRFTGVHCGVRAISLHRDNQLMAAAMEDGSVLFYGLYMPRVTGD
eukprot:TRINITY_DN65457_c0_g1_i3.p3 TRINITY_DN65457_c0_g1~~TRINITY_DN65457_c0_g1_i3.p3  ORF type:complete len:116 (-),score=18.42 TRINITY_DN65457_c0_g1_i3:60-407(-)